MKGNRRTRKKLWRRMRQRRGKTWAVRKASSSRYCPSTVRR